MDHIRVSEPLRLDGAKNIRDMGGYSTKNGVTAKGAFLRADGIEVILNETTHTMHGYDIAENSPYVKEQVRKRISFLTDIFK